MAWKQGLGSTYQAYSSKLTDIAALAATVNNFIVGNGTTWALKTPSDARSSLGLVIGTDVQAYDAQLADVAAVTPSANQFLGGDGSNLVMRTAAQVKASLGYYTSGDSPTFGTATLTAGTISTTPSSDTDIANKAYVDATSTGLSVKAPVAAASTANVATLSGEQTIDGVLTSASRVLLKNQTTGSQNGIYVTAAGAWARATDMDASSGELSGGMYVWVSGGTAQSGTAWVCTNTAAITVGTTATTWEQFSGISTTSAGAGLSKNGNVLDVSVDGASIEISGDALQVKAGGITSAMIANGAIVNDDVNASAAIAYSKLNLSNSLTAGDYTAGSVGAAALAAAVAGDGLSGGAGTALSVNVDDASIGIALDTLGVKDGGITAAKLAAAVAGAGLTGGAGTALAVVSGNGGIVVTADAVTLTADGSTLSIGGSGIKVADALSLVTSLTTPKITNTGALFETGIQEISSAVAIAATTRWVFLSGAAGYALTLPAAVIGRVISFKKATTGEVVLTPASGEYLDGVQNATVTMDTANAALSLVCLANGTWAVY